MDEEKSIIWAGFDVGKSSFVAALDEATASERRRVTALPCREFKRNQDEVKKPFPRPVETDSRFRPSMKRSR